MNLSELREGMAVRLVNDEVRLRVVVLAIGNADTIMVGPPADATAEELSLWPAVRRHNAFTGELVIEDRIMFADAESLEAE